jgi:aldose 1-epimerase
VGVEPGNDQVRLEVGGAVLELAPGIGGGIAGLSILGRDILRRADPDALASGYPLGLAEFPMAPWVNRVAGGRFSDSGTVVQVTADAQNDPLGLHGLAWRLPWAVAERTADMALLRLDWAGEARWPYPFELTRRFVLCSDHLAIDARLRNLGTRPMPAALGFHLYFSSHGAALQAAVKGAWAVTADGIPTSWSETLDAERLSAGAAVRSLDLDHCFTGWDGRAALTGPTHRIAIATEPAASFLQVYAPPDADFFCVEPQTAMPDALNRDLREGGLTMLGKQQVLALRLRLHWSLTGL